MTAQASFIAGFVTGVCAVLGAALIIVIAFVAVTSTWDWWVNRGRFR